MINSKTHKVVLFIAGLISTGFGIAVVFMPIDFFAINGITLGDNINLLNEVRAPGGVMLAGGILIMLGAFLTSLTFVSTVVSTLLYLSYGFSRLLSIAVDGMPSEIIVAATISELIIGFACLFILIKYRSN